MEDDNKLIEERREKLKALRAKGVAYPNDFRREHFAADLHRGFGERSKEELEKEKPTAVIAGRMLLKRVMGKASFATLQDMSGQIQVYINNDVTGAEVHEAFKHWDLGDILGVEGTIFKTNKGELSIHASRRFHSGGTVQSSTRVPDGTSRTDSGRSSPSRRSVSRTPSPVRLRPIG